MRVPRALAKLLYKVAAIPAEDAYTAECAKLPERRVGNVHVHGSEPFLNDVADALTQLQRSYPYGYALVQRYIRGIIGSDTHRRTGYPIQVIFQPATSEGRLPVPPNRFAANLVRYAVVYRKQIGFGLTRCRKSQVQSLNRELHAMRLLQCDQRYFHRPNNLILNLERDEILTKR
jgi:hypothetical protein